MKNNKKINLIFSIMLFIFITFSFSGCAQVRAMIINNEDNTIDELVTISLNVEEVLSAGYNLSELKIDIQTKSMQIAEEMKDKLNSKIVVDLFSTLDVETIETLNSFKDGISVIKSDWKDNTFAIGIRFKNIDVYKYYYNIKEENKVETQTEKHFFYDKVYYYANTMYVKHNELYNLVNNYYIDKYPTLVNSENNELLYTYKTDLRRQHSDADYITKENGEYYHTWVVDKNNLEEPIMFYYNIPNPESYFLVAFGVTAIVGLILGLVVFVRLKMNKKKDSE